MKFYVKRSADAVIEGPFAIDQMHRLLQEQQLALDSLALVDTEQGLEAAGSVPMHQWSKVGEIPEFKPADEERRYVMLIVLIVALLVLIPIAALVVIGILLNRIR